MMRLDAISVGKPRQVQWQGREITTSIYKETVDGSVRVNSHSLEGDEVSDKKLHGGTTRSISVYASEYYEFWKTTLSKDTLQWGYFGENLNISGGMFETQIMVGDRFSIGTVILEALQPRFPCHKLGMKLGDKKWVKFFLEQRKTGFYFGVVQEGLISPGDEVKQIFSPKDSISMDDITDLYLINKDNVPLLEKALAVERLTPGWKAYFREQLERLTIE